MTFAAKSLADGVVPTSVAAIYTSTGVKTVVKAFTLHNTNATIQTTNVYITRSGGTRRKMYTFSAFGQNQSIDVLSDGEVWSLAAGDTIDADTNTASAVEFTILGATE